MTQRREIANQTQMLYVCIAPNHKRIYQLHTIILTYQEIQIEEFPAETPLAQVGYKKCMREISLNNKLMFFLRKEFKKKYGMSPGSSSHGKRTFSH